MKSKIINNFDFENAGILLEGFKQTTNFVTSILDLKGNVLSKSSEREVCKKFHKENSVTAVNCQISDIMLTAKKIKGGKYHFYKCINGLVDVSAPIIIRGEHIANLYTGQIFLKDPNISFFKNQAKKYGFEEISYFEALSEVPIIPKEEVETAMKFLIDIIQMFIEMTVEKLDQLELNEAIKQSEEKYRLIAENASDVISVYNFSENKFTYISPSIFNLRGFTVEEVIDEDFEKDISDNIFRATIKKNSIEFLNNPELKNSYIDEVQLSCKNGKNIWVEISTKYQYNPDGELEAIGISRNIDERKKSDELLLHSEDKFRMLFDKAPLGYQSLDIDGCFIGVNQQWLNMLGYERDEVIGKWFGDFLPSPYQDEFRGRFPVFKSQGYIHSEFAMLHKNGKTIFIAFDGKIGYNKENEFKQTHCILKDVTIEHQLEEERKKADEIMEHLSYYDYLTNLYNRRFYEEELKRLDTERNLPITLVMADVNGLKFTNDAFGHQAGDIILKTIAKILKNECRADEIISRIGGDEFVILIPKCGDEDARHLIDRINYAILKEKEENPILSLSVGYAVKEKKSEKMNEIFKKAEDIMYRHKISETLSIRSKSIDLIMNSLFEKSNRERHHSDRVGSICESIAINMNFSQEDIQQIKIAGRLHDIGKIGVDDSILNKEGKLDKNEWEEMKKHSEIGYRILSPIHEFSEISEYVLSHQERWDGKGYPQNIKGEEIPIQSRIIAVADAFDAMTEQRTYRKIMNETEAADEIRKCAGTQFDSEVAKIFIEKVLNKNW